MIRLQLSARIQKTAGKLTLQQREAANAALTAVAASFGNPHQHSGLGLRKLGKQSYEVRVDINLRIVFIRQGDVLTAYDVMNHGEVRRWVKNQSK